MQFASPAAPLLVSYRQQSAGEDTQLMLNLFAPGDISVQLKVAQFPAGVVAPERPPACHGYSRPLAGGLLQFPVPVRLSAQYILDLRQGSRQLGLEHLQGGLSHGLLLAPSVKLLSAFIPQQNLALAVHHDDRFSRQIQELVPPCQVGLERHTVVSREIWPFLSRRHDVHSRSRGPSRNIAL